jgi:hypothetical protein
MRKEMTMPDMKTDRFALSTLLFNPFVKTARLRALLAGVVIIVVSGCVCFLGNCHFDGVLDAHFGAKAKSPF